MSGVLEIVGVVVPVLVCLVFPAALLWQVLADLRPGTAARPAPTRTAGVSASAQAVLFLTVGTLNTPWGTVPVPLWWLASWLLALGVVVLVLRWRRLATTGPRPRRELVGATVWVLLASALLAVVSLPLV